MPELGNKDVLKDRGSWVGGAENLLITIYDA
jgi:hypothetical protein